MRIIKILIKSPKMHRLQLVPGKNALKSPFVSNRKKIE